MASKPKDQSCSNCRFWINDPDDVLTVDPKFLWDTDGECREGSRHRIEINVSLVGWPLHVGCDWCGRWQAVPPELTYRTEAEGHGDDNDNEGEDAG